VERILEIYIEQFEFDVAAMSQPWMYWCLMIPIVFYVCFFLVKWMVLTAPFWLPIAVIIRLWRGDDFTISIGSRDDEGDDEEDDVVPHMLHYLQELEPDEEVVETGEGSNHGHSGFVYINDQEGPTKGSKCVKWDTGMGTSITHGTRRRKDVDLK